MNKIIDQAYDKAKEVLRACADTKSGAFYASGLPGGYEATWARDSMVTSLGASLLGKEFKTPIRKSLELLSRNQSLLGQIPNCVGSYNLDRKSDVTFNSIDSSLWYIIGFINYALTFGDKDFFNQHRKNLTMAVVWLSYQDPDEVRLLAQQPTMDWQDAFPHKYGYTINSHALYYGVLKLVGKDRQAEHMKRVVNGEIAKYLSLYSQKLGYYYPWAWKNHDGDREHEEWFDSLGNCLAIITGLATPTITKNILQHIEKQKINQPYPLKAIWPTIKPGDKEWHSYFSKCDAREPFHYLNGGIWPFIGGFYVAALVKMKKFDKAEKELKKLAQANLQIINDSKFPDYLEKTAKKQHLSQAELRELRRKEFNECLNGQTGKPTGEPYQAWSAGSFIFACECVKNKKVILFG
jgi:glycogen debranching enzyme